MNNSHDDNDIVKSNQPGNFHPSLDSEMSEPADEERDTIQRMLDVLAREHAEPRDGFEPVPFWVAAIFGALLAWGGYYLGTNSADFRPDVYDRSDLRQVSSGGSAVSVPDPDPQTVPELIKIGEQKYAAICASCHQPHGQGNLAQGIPPLDGSEWVVGEQASPARLARILLYGLTGPITVKGRTYNGLMPAQGNVLKDYEIAAVLTYIRNSWNNNADKDKPPAITAATIKAARAIHGNRKTNGTQPYTVKELIQIPTDYADPGATPPTATKDKK
ncbi:MAG: cytochrome c [Thermogemmata sp.]|jgi:mono/diheme cytochrome c family protein|uniref:Cytochrome c n=1 Tax=Thermogemmata fonticola TaxID=2755323 RepID=A0A7V8VC02_9BACT|nr:cytochrome c [Thermogemmata fonticola]MBA2225251.1 cytochrome c [Thermogemmata fonticola]GIW60974.1 MAG: cytochrome c [Patescibacteria group bacterium]